MVLKPIFIASPILCSVLVTGLISPLSPTSPIKHMVDGMCKSKLEDKIAHTTPKSNAGSFTLIPPAIFKKTSLVAILNPHLLLLQSLIYYF